MIAAAVIAGSGGLLVWPSSRAAQRARAPIGVARGGRLRPWLARFGAGMPVVVAAVLGYLVLNLAGALVCGALVGTAVRRRRSGRDDRDRIEAISAASEAIGALVAELRVGAHPAAAAELVARDLDGGAAAEAMRAVSSATRLGEDVDVVLKRIALGVTPVVRFVLMRLARAWSLAQDHGLPLADVLDAVRADLVAQSRFSARVMAKFAGPRASAAVLAGLPALGLGLGQLIGANPFGVLGSTGAGQVLLVVGGAFLLAGVAWSSRLTSIEVLR